MTITNIIEFPNNDDKTRIINELNTEKEILYTIIIILLMYIFKI